MATLGQQIKTARVKKGVSTEALAKRMKIEEQRLLDLESDADEPGMFELACLMTLLDFIVKPDKFKRPDWFLDY